MPSIEKSIGSSVLTAIRNRRQRAGVRTVPLAAPPASQARLREATFSDFESVAELKLRWGLAADSFENWERLWRYNPALARVGSKHPIGWVLESEGKVVGYLGNILQLYRYVDRTLISATGHAFVVDEPYRGIGVSLSAAYFRQKSIDLFLSTGAIAPVGKIGRAFKSDALCQFQYESALFWILRPYAFSQAVMKKLNVGRMLSSVGSIVASAAVMTDKAIRQRWPLLSSPNLAISEISLDEIGDDFQHLWLHKVNEGPLLLAERSPETLRWHFKIPGDKGGVGVLCCKANSELLGYLVIRDEQPDEAGLIKSIVADMLVKDDNPQVAHLLFTAAYNHAKRVGSHILEALGYPAQLNRVFARSHPYTRKYPSSPFIYKALDPILHEKIADGETWYASVYDGDFTLIRPSYSRTVHPRGEYVAIH
jgi:hypothetical protein